VEMLEQGFKDIENMGIPGSPWRVYVDPSTKEIYYQNFDTGEQISWINYKETDFARIFRADIIGAAEHKAQKIASGK
jgi:hypothetical protein